MTSFTSEKIMKSKSIKSKLAIFWSHVFPNVKDFIVTLLTTVFVLYVMVQLKKKSGHTASAKNQKIAGSSSNSKLIVDLQTAEFDPPQVKELTRNGAWCWFADPRAIYFKGTYNMGK